MKMENLNDGYVKVYRRAQKKQNDFSTPVNTKSKKDLEFVVELAYKEMSKRDQDDQFAESIGRKLSLKVKTRRYEDVDKTMKIVRGSTLYAILKIDYDREKDVMYLYMEEERTLAEGDI